MKFTTRLGTIANALILIVALFALIACGPTADDQNRSTATAGAAEENYPASTDGKDASSWGFEALPIGGLSGQAESLIVQPGKPTGSHVIVPPLGDNPAFDYGPYRVARHTIELGATESGDHSAYVYAPEGTEDTGPLPTLVWGHGMLGAYLPRTQQEIFIRQASKGYLVIYPNMEVPVIFTTHDIMDSVDTYLRAVALAVEAGLADPDRIVFGGYSMGGRVAALAAAVTAGMDPDDQWPNPRALVVEAMRDRGNWGGGPRIGIPGPQPSELADMLDPTMPITVIVAEEDRVNPNYDNDGQPLNGVYFFETVSSDFAQLIVLKSGSTGQDEADHDTFHAINSRSLDVLDLWGHMKIVAGIAQYEFRGTAREWGYGIMRGFGGLDHDNRLILHEVFERHAGGESEREDNPPIADTISE